MGGLRRKRISKARDQLIRQLLDEGLSVKEIGKRAEVSHSKVYEIRGSVRKGREVKKTGLHKPVFDSVAAGRIHQEILLGIVRQAKEGLYRPTWECPIKDFGDVGLHCSEGVAWDSNAQGIRRKLPLTAKGSHEIHLMWECLCEHLASGGYGWLLAKLEEWERVGGQELEKRAALLKEVDNRLVEKLASVRGEPGKPTPFFGGTLVAALVDGLALKYSFGGEPGVPQYTSYSGGFPIGLAATRDPGHAFQEYHKALVAALDGHPLTEIVRGLASKLGEIGQAIEKGFSEMLIQGYVPGSCRHCPS